MPNSSSQFRDYYGELGIGPDASDADIRTAWRKVAKRWHPDINRSPDAEEMMKRINVARDVLSDPRSRVEYDATYRQQQSGGTGGTGKEGSHGKREERRREREERSDRCGREPQPNRSSTEDEARRRREEGETRRQREAHEQARRESQRDQERRDRDSRQGHWSEARDRDAARPNEFYLAAWRRTFDFRGMSTRTEFWAFTLINIVVGILLLMVWSLTGEIDEDGVLQWNIMGYVWGAFTLLVLVPSLTALIRRVRDATGSGWWVLTWWIPFIGPIVVLVMTLMPTKNR